MFNLRHFVALTLIASTSLPAQGEYPVIASWDHWVAQSYGSDVATEPARKLDLGLEPLIDVEPIALAWEGPVGIVCNDGQAGAPVSLMFGLSEARLSLIPLAEGTLLLNPILFSVNGTFDSSGKFALVADFNDPALNDLAIHMQAASIARGDGGLELQLSGGVRVTVEFVPTHNAQADD